MICVYLYSENPDADFSYPDNSTQINTNIVNIK